jgi:lipopolysaccharide export system permease protein
MNLAQQYVFRKLRNAFLVAFPAVALTIWATQALRQLSLVTDQGQGLAVFAQATLLLLPGLFLVIGPVAMLIIVVYVINGLNSDSELVILNSSGRSSGILIRPLLTLAIPILILSAVASIYFRPLAAREGQVLVAEVNARAIGSLIRPGQFLTLQRNVVIHVRNVAPGGALNGIFVFDQREPAESVSYIAGRGALVNRPEGVFLIMEDGVIQRRSADGTMSAIEFESYTFDLSTLGNRTEVALGAGERDFLYLFNPDPDDPVLTANPYRYAAEIHARITTPFYVLILTLVPAAFLATARSPRERRPLRTIATILFSVLLLGFNLFAGAALERSPWLVIPVYGIPILGIAGPILLMASGVSLRLPRWPRLRTSY